VAKKAKTQSKPAPAKRVAKKAKTTGRPLARPNRTMGFDNRQYQVGANRQIVVFGRNFGNSAHPVRDVTVTTNANNVRWVNPPNSVNRQGNRILIDSDLAMARVTKRKRGTGDEFADMTVTITYNDGEVQELTISMIQFFFP
jgi:hypothetical protein